MSRHLEEFLKRNRELCDRSTGGKWDFVGVNDDYSVIVRSPHKHICDVGAGDEPEIAAANAALISASRTSLPLALEMIEVAQRGLRESCFCGEMGGGGDELCPACEALAALEEKAGRG